MKENIYNSIRPTCLSEMFKTTSSLDHVKTLLASGKIGRSIFLYGATGCGKTTLARIIAKHMNCTGSKEKPCGVCAQCTNATVWSIIETNAADQRGIDDMRSLIEEISVPPLNSDFRTVILDEAHQLSKDAQNALLKVVEECPEYLSVILCTTEPGKVLPTLKNRCFQVGFDRLGYSESRDFVLYTIERLHEKGHIETKRVMPEPMLETIIGLADGSARQLTVLTYMFEETGTVSKVDTEQEIMMKDIARVILGECRWKALAPLIKKIKTDHEIVRIHLVNYFAAIATNPRDSTTVMRCYELISRFSEPLSPSNQKADFIGRMIGLIHACRTQVRK